MTKIKTELALQAGGQLVTSNNLNYKATDEANKHTIFVRRIGVSRVVGTPWYEAEQLCQFYLQTLRGLVTIVMTTCRWIV